MIVFMTTALNMLLYNCNDKASSFGNFLKITRNDERASNFSIPIYWGRGYRKLSSVVRSL